MPSNLGEVLDPIITMNTSGVIQSASASVLQVFGWTPAELFGRNVKVLIPEPRRTALDRYLDRYRRADPSKAMYRTNQFDAQRKDGSQFRIELSVSRADLPAQAPPYFIGIIRDVSRKIEVGNDGVGERTRLQRLVTEQTRALATASLRLHLTDRLASLGTLAAGLGHDLNNVLLPVRARLNAIEHDGLSVTGQKHLTAVRRSITYLQHLSDGFHFLALDPDTVSDTIEPEGSTDLAQWWSQMGELLKRAIPSRVSLRVSIPENIPLVAIAPHWLTQAMLNLIVNAGESINVRKKGRVNVWAKAGHEGRTVRIGVTDNGQGMGRGVLRRAFDLFFTTKSRRLGTGLGLPLAQKVARRAGGEIELTSAVGKGTTATMILQAASGSKSTGAQKRPLAILSIGNRRSTALVTQVLIAAGCDIATPRTAGSNAAALWVTTAVPSALSSAQTWRRHNADGILVLVGHPAQHASSKWSALQPIVIDPPDDFEAVLHTLREVTRQVTFPPRSQPRKKA